jgi:hypothetical protein
MAVTVSAVGAGNAISRRLIRDPRREAPLRRRGLRLAHVRRACLSLPGVGPLASRRGDACFQVGFFSTQLNHLAQNGRER